MEKKPVTIKGMPVGFWRLVRAEAARYGLTVAEFLVLHLAEVVGYKPGKP